MAAIDTIAAIATPAGAGGVGIVRISGPDALVVASRVFTPSSVFERMMEERRLYYGRVHDARGVIDDAFMAYFKAPRSFTGEDTIEFQCHGNPLALDRVMSAVLLAGASEAGPGAFSRQAFTNGRMDLAQAEALLDLIRAGSESALASARIRLDGRLSQKIRLTKDAISAITAQVEAALDFPDDFSEDDGAKTNLASSIDKPREELKTLLSGYLAGKAAIEGANVLILGRPNVGKSSLLNALLREERAVVTPLPGTTRDVLIEAIDVKGLCVKLMDTAGLRNAIDEAEAMGIRFAFKRIPEADVVLFVIDATADDFGDDLALLQKVGDKRVVIAANKIDAAGATARERIFGAFPDKPVVFISALKDIGIKELEDAVYEAAVGKKPLAGGLALEAKTSLVTSSRHRALIEASIEALDRAAVAFAQGTALDATALDLHVAMERLSEITGENATEEILDRIFNEFCIGK